MKVLRRVVITPESVVLDENKLIFDASGLALIEMLYDEYVADYPKFYKMDPMAKLGFIASEMLLGRFEDRKKDREDMAVILFGKTASLCDDMLYQHGETSFYVLEHKDENVMDSMVEMAFQDEATRSVITGWLECPDEEHFECDLKIMEK